nr:MAG TPA: hypothetical protein [Caudoviricetes sp.]
MQGIDLFPDLCYNTSVNRIDRFILPFSFIFLFDHAQHQLGVCYYME